MTRDYIIIQDENKNDNYFRKNGSCLTGNSDMNLIELSTFVNLNKFDEVFTFLEKEFEHIDYLAITDILDDGRLIVLMYRNGSLYKCVAVDNSWSFAGT